MNLGIPGASSGPTGVRPTGSAALPLAIFAIWSILALAVLLPISGLLDGSFPILTVAWILVPLGAALLTKDARRIGFRTVPWRSLIPTTAICTGAMLSIGLMVEPWSHTSIEPS